MPPLIVEPYTIAATTSVPPPMTITRGGNQDTSCEDAARPMPIALANGMKLPAAVCSVSFKPLAGYVPSRATIKYLVKRHDMDVALAPIAGTRVMVPIRVRIPTPIGLGMVQAVEFNTVAQPQASKRAN